MADANEDTYDVFLGRCFKNPDGEAERTLDQFKNQVIAGTIAYEALYDEVVPPYDYDEKITDGRNLKDAHADAYEKATNLSIPFGVLRLRFMRSRARGKRYWKDTPAHL